MLHQGLGFGMLPRLESGADGNSRFTAKAIEEGERKAILGFGILGEAKRDKNLSNRFVSLTAYEQWIEFSPGIKSSLNFDHGAKITKHRFQALPLLIGQKLLPIFVGNFAYH